MAHEFDHRDLQAQADAQVGHIVLARVLRRQLLALDATAAEAAGHQDSLHIGEDRVEVCALLAQLIRLHPLDAHPGVVGDAAVLQRLHHGEVRVVQLDVLAHQRDGDLLLRLLEALHQQLPVGKVGLADLHVQRLAHLVGEALLLQHQRHLVQRLRVQVLNDVLRGHVAELGQLLPHLHGHGVVAATHQHVRLDALGLELLDGVLGGLGLELLGGLQVGDQRDVDEQHVLPGHLPLELAQRLDEGLALDVADGAADLGDDHVLVLGDAVQLALDLVGDVGNDLHRAAVVCAAALLVQHRPEDLAGGDGGIPGQVFVDEALVVAQIQVGLHAVLGDEHLAVLVGVHGAGVHVQIGIELLVGDRVAPGLEQPSQGCCGDALAQ